MTTILDALKPVLDGIDSIAGSSHIAGAAVGAMLLMWKGGALASILPFTKGLLGIGAAERGAAAGANLDAAATSRLMAISAVAARGGTAAEATAAGEAAAAAAGGGAGRGLLAKLGGLGTKAGAGVETGGLAVGGALEWVGLGGAGAGVVATAGEIAPVVAAAIPMVLAAGGGVLALRMIASSLGVSFAATTSVSSHTPPGSAHLQQGGVRSSLPGFLGTAESTVANAGLHLLGISTGSTLSIKEVGNFANYSAAQLRALIKEMKTADAVKLNGVAVPKDQLLSLARAALKSKDALNLAFGENQHALDHWYMNTGRTLGLLEDDFATHMRRIAADLGTNSTRGRDLVAENVHKMVGAVSKGMLDGRISVAHGMAAINSALQTGMQDGAVSWNTAWQSRFSTVNRLYAANKIDTSQYVAQAHRIQTRGDAQILADTKASTAEQIAALQHRKDQGLLTAHARPTDPRRPDQDGQPGSHRYGRVCGDDHQRVLRRCEQGR